MLLSKLFTEWTYFDLLTISFGVLCGWHGMYVFGEEFGNMHLAGMLLWVVLYATVIALAPYTYYLALFPVLQKYKKPINQVTKNNRFLGLFIFSFIVSLCVTMGRFARTNSWYVVSDPMRVANDVFHSLASSDTTLFMISFFIGVLTFNLLILNRLQKGCL